MSAVEDAHTHAQRQRERWRHERTTAAETLIASRAHATLNRLVRSTLDASPAHGALPRSPGLPTRRMIDNSRLESLFLAQSPLDPVAFLS